MSSMWWVVGAVLVTGTIVWLLGRAKTATLTAELTAASRDRDKAYEDLSATNLAVASLQSAVAESQATCATLAATLEAERKANLDKQEMLVQTEQRVREVFAAVSQQALQTNNQSFLDLAAAKLSEVQAVAQADLDLRRKAVEQLVEPIQAGLERIGTAVLQFDQERVKGSAALDQHLRLISESQRALTEETQQLVKALRAPQVRGQWGEMQLRRVVELAGMLSHCDFLEQGSVDGDNGKLRPDLVVHLPADKLIVVDSKAPLNAYLDALEVQDPELQRAHLDRHAKQVRGHIDDLSGKDYANQFPSSPDFVVLFLPGEAFFSAACQRDPALVDYAISRNVIPASPTTLITILKAVSYGWQQERIAKNAEEIRDLGVELYQRTQTVAEHLDKVRKGLETAVKGYNAAVGSLESRFLPTARRLGEMTTGKSDGIEVLEPVSELPRLPAAQELTGPPDGRQDDSV